MALHSEPGVPDTPVTSGMEERILDRLRESMQALFREHARELSGPTGGNQSSSSDQQQPGLVTTQPTMQSTVDVPNGDEKDEWPDDQSDYSWKTQNWNWYGWNYTPKTTHEPHPYISHLTFPDYNGSADGYFKYRYQVMNLKSQCSESDYKYLAPKVIAKFKGPLLEDVQRMGLNANDDRTKDGIEKLPAFLQ